MDSSTHARACIQLVRGRMGASATQHTDNRAGTAPSNGDHSSDGLNDLLKTLTSQLVHLTADGVFDEFARAEIEQTHISLTARILSNTVFDEIPDNAAAVLADCFRDDYEKNVAPVESLPKISDAISEPLIQSIEETLDHLEVAQMPDIVEVLRNEYLHPRDRYEARDLAGEAQRHAKGKEPKRFKRFQEAFSTGEAAEQDGTKKRADAKQAVAITAVSTPAPSSEKSKEKSTPGDRRENHASKWMSRKASVLAKANVHLWEVVRGLLTELSGVGLEIRAVDKKLEDLLASGCDKIRKEQQEEQPQPQQQQQQAPKLETDGNNDADADFESKPIPRAASSVASECVQSFRNQLQAFDSVWNNLRGDCEESYRKRWNSMAALRAAIDGRKSGIEDVPASAGQLCNPFASNSGPSEQWEWLVNPKGYLEKAGDDAHRDTTNGDYSPDSVTHPLVHPKSIHAGHVSLSSALPEPLLNHLLSKDSRQNGDGLATSEGLSQAENQSTIDSMFDESENGDVNDGYGMTAKSSSKTGKPRGRPPSNGSSTRKSRRQSGATPTKVPPREVAKLPAYLENLSNGDPEFDEAMVMQHQRAALDVSRSEAFQDCLDRLLHLLEADLNTLFVDKTTCVDRPPTFPDDPLEAQRKVQAHYPDAMHRAQMVAQVVNKTVGVPSFLEATARRSGVRKTMTSYQRWGPFLVVVPKSQILSWIFTFEHHCPNLRVLPYWGGAADRALLRSYMSPDELYTARSGVHIFVTSYNVMQCDIEHLRQIHWQLMVLDEPFAVLANSNHTPFCDELLNLSYRQLLLTCSRLSDNFGLLPTMRAVISAMYPTILDVLLNEMDEENVGLDMKTLRLLRRLAGSLTVVYDPEVSLSQTDDVMTKPKELYHSLAQLMWSSISYPKGGDAKSAQYAIEEVRETEAFEDGDVQDELTRGKLEDVSDAKKRKAPKGKLKRAKGEGDLFGEPLENGGHEAPGQFLDDDADSNPSKKHRQSSGAGECGGVVSLPTGQWSAQLEWQGQTLSLGVFEDVAEANNAFQEALRNNYGDVKDLDTADEVPMDLQLSKELPTLDLDDIPDNLEPMLRRKPYSSPSSSKYRGVCRSWRKGQDKWQAQIAHNGVNYYLGLFDTELDAGRAYARAHVKLYGSADGSIKADPDVHTKQSVGSHTSIKAEPPPAPLARKISDSDLAAMLNPSGVRAAGKAEGGTGDAAASKRPPSSKFRGVSKRGKKWQAQITINGKNRYLGTFESELEAAVAYSDATLEMFGEEAVTGSSLGRAQLKKIMLPGFSELAVEQSVLGLSEEEILDQLQQRRAKALVEDVFQQEHGDDYDQDNDPVTQAALAKAPSTPPFFLPPNLYSPAKEEPMAYAKLWVSADAVIYLRKQVFVIGRANNSFQRAATSLRMELPIGTHCGSVDCHLGNDASVDYEHAAIEWNQAAQQFQLRCLSTNGSVFVDKDPVFAMDEPVILTTGSVIQIGATILFFLLPRPVSNRQLANHVVKDEIDALRVPIMNHILERRFNMGHGVVLREQLLGKEFAIRIKRPHIYSKKSGKSMKRQREQAAEPSAGRSRADARHPEEVAMMMPMDPEQATMMSYQYLVQQMLEQQQQQQQQPGRSQFPARIPHMYDSYSAGPSRAVLESQQGMSIGADGYPHGLTPEAQQHAHLALMSAMDPMHPHALAAAAAAAARAGGHAGEGYMGLNPMLFRLNDPAFMHSLAMPADMEYMRSMNEMDARTAAFSDAEAMHHHPQYAAYAQHAPMDYAMLATLYPQLQPSMPPEMDPNAKFPTNSRPRNR